MCKVMACEVIPQHSTIAGSVAGLKSGLEFDRFFLLLAYTTPTIGYTVH